MSITLAAIVVSVFLVWVGSDNAVGTKVFREIAGTFEQVGEVGPHVVDWNETLTAIEGAQLCYVVRPFEEPESNEWCGMVPTVVVCTPPNAKRCR
jgi:hypothetical protein